MSKFPSKSKANTRTIFEGRVMEVTGLPTTYAIPSVGNVVIPCDNVGANPNYDNNLSYLHVYKGGVLQTGWAIGSNTRDNCGFSWGVQLNQLFVRITSITDDTGWLEIELTKAGEPSVPVRVTFTKQYAGAVGAQGAQGIQGVQGIQGETGVAGNDGAGINIKKYVVEVKVPALVTVSNVSGQYRLTYPAPHGLELGDPLLVFEIDPAHDRPGVVRDVISTTVVDTTCVYRDPAFKNVRELKHFAQGDLFNRFNGTQTQELVFPEIMPVGAKAFEVYVQKVAGAAWNVQWNVGYAAYPYTGWDAYMSSKSIQAARDIEAYSLFSSGGPYITEPLDPIRYLYAQVYPVSGGWETEGADNIWNIFLSYIFYNTDLTT